LSGIALGCPRDRPRPEEALEAFLADIQYGRADAAWAALSEGSRQSLIERHRTLATGAGEATEETPAQILFGDLNLVVMSPPESIIVASPLGNEVMLRVAVAGGKSADIRMVREGVAWKVDLTSSLHPAPPLDAMLPGTSTISADLP
jgi:hypothetical protein